MRTHALTITAALLTAALAIGTPCPADADQDASDAQARRLAALRARGAEATLLVYPVAMAGKPSKDVADVIGLMLEKAGLAGIHTTATEFVPAGESDFEQIAGQFGEFVRGQDLKTEYALYAQFLGDRRTGVEEVRAVIVNAAGELVWLDRQTPQDEDFQRIKPRNPMSCCMLLGERLKPVLDLENAAPVTNGRMQRLWEKKSGTPDAAEREAIEKREQALRAAGPDARITIYPVRIGDEVDRECATHLAQLLNEAGLCRAAVAEQGPHLEVAGSSNEQRVLWNLARAFKQYLVAEPVQADYGLYADYMISPRTQRVLAVHFVVCDRQGEWVIVDFQNSHQADFSRIRPESKEDCDRLVATRMERYLR